MKEMQAPLSSIPWCVKVSDAQSDAERHFKSGLFLQGKRPHSRPFISGMTTEVMSDWLQSSKGL